MRFALGMLTAASLFYSALAQLTVLSLPSASIAECAQVVLCWEGGDADIVSAKVGGQTLTAAISSSDRKNRTTVVDLDISSGKQFSLSLITPAGESVPVTWGDVNGPAGASGTTFTVVSGTNGCEGDTDDNALM